MQKVLEYVEDIYLKKFWEEVGATIRGVVRIAVEKTIGELR